MPIKIAFTGPESSGKTTLAKLVANTFNTIWIEEYAREYLSVKSTYTQANLDEIARKQMEKWNIESDFLIADTELTVIKVWSEYRFGGCSDFILDAYKNQVFDHYFLCKPDIPWEDDPLRENPDNRDDLFELYSNELLKMQRSFTIVYGNLENRLKICKQAISRLLNG
jgi:nicotinamide riboside kinase